MNSSAASISGDDIVPSSASSSFASALIGLLYELSLRVRRWRREGGKGEGSSDSWLGAGTGTGRAKNHFTSSVAVMEVKGSHVAGKAK